mmetsp:Transcript_37926/g.100291  ORF Transcript_37926/g.100291 Transcript_37926/m.100291 type:complete len:174 (-) Transcript_37926:1019-1540(-)
MCMWMSWRSAIAGATCLCASIVPVIGEMSEVISQRSIALRSKVCPSAVVTGSRITSPVMGQMNCDGVSFGGIGGAVRLGERAVEACGEALHQPSHQAVTSSTTNVSANTPPDSSHLEPPASIVVMAAAAPFRTDASLASPSIPGPLNPLSAAPAGWLGRVMAPAWGACHRTYP